MALVLKGGRVVDPGRGLDARLDVRIDGGRIVALGANVVAEGDEVRELQGAVVTPGLIDAHVHAYEGVGMWGIDPDIVGVGSGVTTIFEAGSSGAATFEGLRRYVMGRAKTKVLAFISISMAGTPAGPGSGELALPGAINEEVTERVVEENRDVIVGIKLRAAPSHVGEQGLKPIRRGMAVAERLKLPVMVHIAEKHLLDVDPIPIQDVVELLRPGDIVTHFLTEYPGGLLDGNKRLVPEVREAQASGLRFDVGHGLFNFSVDTAKRLFDQGLHPHTISTDGHRLARQRVVYDLPTTMAKFLALGFSLAEVVEKATYEPARSVGRPELVPGLAVGQEANLSVFRLEDAEWQAEDSMGRNFTASKRIVPLLAILGDEVFEALPAVRP